MAYKSQASFSAGELDPALQERTNLEKYQSGLNLSKGWVVAKTGRLITAPGRLLSKTCKSATKAVTVYSPPKSNYVLEWGHQYVRIYNYNTDTLVADLDHDFTEADIPFLHFESSQNFVYIFLDGNTLKKLDYIAGAFIDVGDIFALPIAPTYVDIVFTGTGYDVDYLVTFVVKGQESNPSAVHVGAKIPIATGTQNSIIYNTPVVAGVYDIATVTEMRVYRRPTGAGSFGYIGSSSAIVVDTGNIGAEFIDLGQDADYTHGPPDFDFPLPVTAALSKTGGVYQQRLIISEGSGYNAEALHASRAGYQNNFSRDFPLAADSGLTFKAGTSGYAKIRRIIDHDGLVVFTSVGPFLNQGSLAPDNLALDKKGGWVIQDNLPPLVTPGGLLFVDETTNSVRLLAFSLEANSYTAEELSIFSNHLMLGRKLVSWCFQEGNVSLLWCVFNDGKYAGFTFEKDQQMKAWTSHESELPVEYVASLGAPDECVFVVNKNGQRYLELTTPRYTPVAVSLIDRDARMNASIAAMHGTVTYRNLLNFSLTGTDTFTLTPVVSDTWDGELTLTDGTSGLLPSPGAGAIGTILRVFLLDGTSIDLKVTARASDNSVTVQPSFAYPSDEATNVRIHVTKNVITGLTHLIGENPAVIVDGYVVCSPYNDDQNYPVITVANDGTLTLPNGMTGAFVHVGRPYPKDIETLDMDTVEQRPILIESKIVNKVYVKVFSSRGLYVGAKFPEGNGVAGMDYIGEVKIDYDSDVQILGNRFVQPQTQRCEVTITGDWAGNGRICIRQPDPIHSEILSIIPDVEDERR